MKRIAVFLLGLALLFSMVGGAAAVSFTDSATQNVWIDTSGSGAAGNGWFNLGLPTLADWGLSTYSQVDLFTITLSGYGDNSSQAINMFLDFDDDHSSGGYTSVAAYNVQNNVPFTLTLDIKNKDLLYAVNGGTPQDVGNLADNIIDLFDNAGVNSFWLGYGCHFWHDASTVTLSKAGGGQPPVPEPATMLLLGTGLVGFAVPRLRKRTPK